MISDPSNALVVLYPNAISGSDYLVVGRFLTDKDPPNTPTDSNGRYWEIRNWNPALGAQPTDSQIAAVTPQQIAAAKTSQLHTGAINLFGGASTVPVTLRALLLVQVDLINKLLARLAAYDSAVASAAGGIVLLQQKWAQAVSNNPLPPSVTPTAAKQAVTDKIISGSGD